MFKRIFTRRVRWIAAMVLLFTTLSLVSCVRFSDGTWVIDEAPLPEGWPSLTPVGGVEVKQIPGYRAAVAKPGDEQGGNQNRLFRELFDHIKQKKIAMTAPVEMEYTASDDRPAMTSMAFLYRTQQLGTTGSDGSVDVVDVAPQKVVSIGVRGSYTDARMQANLARLDKWLEENGEKWQRAGKPRYLGYNSPFVPSFMRYGEVQIPIEAAP